MTETALPIPPKVSGHVEHVFSTLTPAQITRVAPHGRVRPIHQGEC